MTGAWRKAAALAALLAACWGVMAGVDYRQCAQGKEPVFAAIDHGVVCEGFYRGLGYTVTLGYDGERIRGAFSWGWGFPE